MTGIAAPLPLPPPFPPPRVVELGTSTVDVLKRDILVDVLKRDILVDGGGMGIVNDNGNDVTITLPGGDDDGDGTTTGDSVGITSGLILTVVVAEISPPPGSVVGAPPSTGKPAAPTQV